MQMVRLCNAVDLSLFYGGDYGGSVVNEHFLILGKASSNNNTKYFRINNYIYNINWSIGNWSRVAETCLLSGHINVNKIQSVKGIIDIDEWMASLDVGFTPIQFPYKLDLMRYDLQTQAIDLEFSDRAYGVAEKMLQPKKESNALADVYLEMLLEQIAYLYTLMRIYGKFDKEKEPITTAVANALVLAYARLS